MAKFNNKTRKETTEVKDEIVEEIKTTEEVVEEVKPVEEQPKVEEPKITPFKAKKVTKSAKSSSLAEFLF